MIYYQCVINIILLKKIVDNIFAVASSAPSISSSDYNKMLNTIFSSYEVRNSHISHDNILIWGTLEARANGTDLLILSGLNEGIWPAQPEPAVRTTAHDTTLYP